MPAKNKIQIIFLAFFTGLMILDGYTIFRQFNLIQKQEQLKLQIVRNTSNVENNYNSFAEFPDNEIPFDLYSWATVFNSVLQNNPKTTIDIHHSTGNNTSSSNNIIQNHLFVCNVDLPPPFKAV